jgi:hypothetical protein
MAFIFRPVCHWYSATDVEKIVKLAIQQTVEEMLDRQIADLERLSDELENLESRLKC